MEIVPPVDAPTRPSGEAKTCQGSGGMPSPKSTAVYSGLGQTPLGWRPVSSAIIPAPAPEPPWTPLPAVQREWRVAGEGRSEITHADWRALAGWHGESPRALCGGTKDPLDQTYLDLPQRRHRQRQQDKDMRNLFDRLKLGNRIDQLATNRAMSRLSSHALPFRSSGTTNLPVSTIFKTNTTASIFGCFGRRRVSGGSTSSSNR